MSVILAALFLIVAKMHSQLSEYNHFLDIKAHK